MKNLRQEMWLAGCGLAALLCVSCDDTPKSNPDDQNKEQGSQQQQNGQDSSGGPNSGLGSNVTKTGALPSTCAQVQGQGACGKILGCVEEDGTCVENTSLATENCGNKSQDDCLKESDCNYSAVLDRCFDSEGSGKKTHAPATCKGIGETFTDAEKECNKAIGCKWNSSKCEEDTTLTSTGGCNGKGEPDCRQQPTCTWAPVVQKCFNEASVTTPTLTLNSCADVPLAKCRDKQTFGCTLNATNTACVDNIATTNDPPCNGLTTVVTCNASVYCGWSGPRNQCLKKETVTLMSTCADLAQATCQADPGCTWNLGACVNAAGAAAPCSTSHNTGNATNDRASCSKDMRCQWSGARVACYNKQPSLATPITCAALPVGSDGAGGGDGLCVATYGCEVNGDVCQNNVAINDNPPCNHVKDDCLKDARCQYSAARGCLNKPTLTNGLARCADVPMKVCRNMFGCKNAIPPKCVDENHAGMPSNAPCSNHNNNKRNCWAAGCIYSKIALRAAAGHGAAAVYGGCFDPPGYDRPKGFCYGAKSDNLAHFCSTAGTTQETCEKVKLHNNKMCVWKDKKCLVTYNNINAMAKVCIFIKDENSCLSAGGVKNKTKPCAWVKF